MQGRGLLNTQIAWELDIIETMVKAQMTAIMRKRASTIGPRN